MIMSRSIVVWSPQKCAITAGHSFARCGRSADTAYLSSQMRDPGQMRDAGLTDHCICLI